ncbi:MAG: nucleotidyl transferase AbiEii/AbiGii toxin family protein [Saprospiraceae bacterium]|nr:nucleotidyl transferase AbiEii/AbiGii toxin family protein [Saprospiraceae bacterium]
MLYTKTITGTALELLTELMSLPALRQFALVGGTNLSLRFGHRLSIDLDLFTNEPFDTEFTYNLLEAKFANILQGAQSDTMLFIYINEVKIDLVLLPYPYLKPIEELEGIRLVSLEDVAAMKLSAIARRGVKKDFWDIAELLEVFTLDEMIEFYKLKYASRDIFHLLRSLVYFNDAETQKDPDPLKKTTWQQVKIVVQDAVELYLKKHI